MYLPAFFKADGLSFHDQVSSVRQCEHFCLLRQLLAAHSGNIRALFLKVRPHFFQILTDRCKTVRKKFLCLFPAFCHRFPKQLLLLRQKCIQAHFIVHIFSSANVLFYHK